MAKRVTLTVRDDLVALAADYPLQPWDRPEAAMSIYLVRRYLAT